MCGVGGDDDGARRQAAASDSTAEYTVDQLAAAAGTMTSTVRMYQARGLLPPPVKRGRMAVYGTLHLERLRMIAELQRRGHSLAGIKELLRGVDQGQPLHEVVGVRTWGQPVRRSLTVPELLARLTTALSAADVVRAVDLGLIEPDGDRFVVDERFLEVGARLVQLGVPVGVVLDEWARLLDDARAIARRYSGIFERDLLTDGADLPTIAAVLDELGPLAQEVTRLALERALVDEANRFAERHGG